MKKVVLTIGTIALIGFSSAKAQTLCFDPAVNYTAGNPSPYCMTSSDFNHDGIKDLVVGRTSGVSVLLGNGTGGFGAAISAIQNDGLSITCADFNGDGNVDIAATTPNGLMITLGNGNGSFGGSIYTFVSGTNATSITSGDYNGDGKIDLVYTGNYILLNTTTSVNYPTFSTATTFPQCGFLSYSIITADFNGDGKADLAEANHDSSSVSVYMGNGNGTFSGHTNFAVGSGAYSTNGAVSVLSADVNGDSKLDLLVTNGSKNIVSVLLGTGTGSFGTQSNYTTDWYPWSVAAADFNGDGKIDFATANYSSNNTVSVLLGTGTGNFGTSTNYTVGTLPRSIVSGDFNGDGKIDLVTANANSYDVSVLLNCAVAGIEQYTSSNAVSIYPNPSNGSFVIEPNSSAKQTMQIYDVNGKLVLSQTINGKTTIDASSLNEGVYNISLLSNEGVVNKRLVIVR